MKKIYISIAGVSLLLVIILTAIYIITTPTSFDSSEKLLTIKSNYTYNIYSEKNIELIIYSNNPKSYLKQYKDEEVSFVNKDDTTLIAAIVEDVKLIQTNNYYNETMYGYKLYIKPDNFNSKFSIKNCYIKTFDFKLEIGNLDILKLTEKDSYLDYTKIFAIGNDYFNFKTINAFVVTFSNKGLTPITIDKFYIGPNNYVSLNHAKVAPDDITPSSSLEEVLEDYNPLYCDDSKGSLEIPSGKEVTYVIPVYYNDVLFLGNTLIHINNSIYIDNFNYIKNYDNLAIYEGIIFNATFYNTK